MKTKCPNCKSLFKIDMEKFGQQCECPNCQHIFVAGSCEEEQFRKQRIVIWGATSIAVVALCISVLALIFSLRGNCNISVQTQKGDATLQSTRSGIPQKYVEIAEYWNLSKKEIDQIDQQPSAKALQATMPTSPTKLTLLVSLDDFYCFGYFNGKKDFYCIGCDFFDPAHPQNPDSFGCGYALRNSKTGKVLFEKLKDGKRHVATLSIFYDFRSQGHGSQFAIDEVYDVH